MERREILLITECSVIFLHILWVSDLNTKFRDFSAVGEEQSSTPRLAMKYFGWDHFS